MTTKEQEPESQIITYDYYYLKKHLRKLKYLTNPYKLTSKWHFMVILTESYVKSITFDISYTGKYKVKIDFTNRKSGGIVYTNAFYWATMFLRHPMSKELFDVIRDDMIPFYNNKTYQQMIEIAGRYLEIGEFLGNKIYLTKINIEDDNLTIITQKEELDVM